MEKQQQHYLSYLLRLWQTGDGGQQIWRASLEIPGAGERQGFASLQDLFDFLAAQAGQAELWDPQDKSTAPTRRREETQE